MFQFQALSSRRFQLEFDRVKLHRPTVVRQLAQLLHHFLLAAAA
jgi:hypothetical protein